MIKRVHHHLKQHYHKRYHGVYAHAKQLFVFDIGLLLIAVFMLGASLFFFFWKPGIMDQIELNLSIGSERLKSGEEALITAEFYNHSKLKLNNAVLAVRLPPGFVVDRTKTPETEFSKQSTFDIGDIEPGGSAGRGVYGYLWATPKEDTKILASLTYQPENSKRIEQKLGALIANLPESILKTTLNVAASSFPHSELPFTFTITNYGTQTVEGLKAPSTWDGDIKLDNQLFVTTLKPGDSATASGVLITPNKAGDVVFSYNPTVVINNHTISQGEIKKQIAVFYPAVTSAAKLTDSAVTYAEAGQTISVDVSWKNTSEFELNNQRLRINVLPAGVADLNATAKLNNFKLDKTGLYADSLTRTALTNGKPGASDDFEFKVVLLPHFAPGLPENSKLIVTPVLTSELPQVPGQTFSQPGQSVELPLATELTMNQSVRYYTDEGDQLGRGPLPPRVGQTTKYWIFNQITNGTNAVKDAAFKVTLGNGVTFTGKQSVTIGPELKYNKSDNKVTWSFGELPANSITGLYFEVAVTPTSDQVGKSLTLASQSSFGAADAVVDKAFNLTKTSLTNLLGKSDRGSYAGAGVIGK